MLTGAHVHLLFNHFPITGGAIALLVLAWGWLRRDDAVVRTACGLFVLIAVLTAVAYLSGEPAEKVLRRAGDLPRSAGELVHKHEEAAEAALIMYGVLGVLALFTLIRYARRALPRALTTVLLVVALAAAGWTSYVGWLGGPIRHAEVRAGALPADSAAAPAEDAD